MWTNPNDKRTGVTSAADSGSQQIVDPAKQVRELYAHFGWPYPPEMDARIAAWQEEHPKGKHDARPEFFGLDPEAVNEEFRFYTERFGL